MESLRGQQGFDESAFLKVHEEEERITSIRLNPFKAVSPDFELNNPVNWCYNGYYLDVRPSFTADPLFHAGAYYVQEAGSMFLDKVLRGCLDPGKSLTILDLCAAPGGKSTLINSFISPDSLLIANEVIKQRAGILAANLSRWGTTNTIVTNNDPSHFGQLPEVFDAIVIDAPCSGSGLFRKQPEAVAEWSEENVNLCSARQKRIVADVLPALKTGGYIIYSTCSYSVVENEAQVEWMEKELGLNYRSLPEVPEEGIIDTGKGYRFYPHLVNSEGFFIAVLQKTEATTVGQPYVKTEKLAGLTARERQLLEPYLKKEQQGNIFKHAALFKQLNATGRNFLEKYGRNFYIRKAGMDVCQFKRDELIPEQDWAWGIQLPEAISKIELTKEEALRYLKKDTVLPESAKQNRGLALLTYKEAGLGFGKLLSGRLNNYLPAYCAIVDKSIGLI